MTSINITIDFEDFSHDLKRDLGIWKTGPLREDALWHSFYKIEKFKKAKGIDGITFFCTGVIAKKCPSLIKEIAAAGNEIACHYYYHDSLIKDGYEKVEKNLIMAKDVLQNTAQKELLGFRAPKFSINPHDTKMFEIISRYFQYDSSLSSVRFNENKNKLTEIDMVYFPLNSTKIGGRNLQLGGSFLKIIPNIVLKSIINNAIANEEILQLYLHPYEFLQTGDFLLSKSEFQGVSTLKRKYWMLRQHQWHTFYNKRILGVVDDLCRDLCFGRTLSDNLVR
jgi:hypothetical protein